MNGFFMLIRTENKNCSHLVEGSCGLVYVHMRDGLAT